MNQDVLMVLGFFTAIFLPAIVSFICDITTGLSYGGEIINFKIFCFDYSKTAKKKGWSIRGFSIFPVVTIYNENKTEKQIKQEAIIHLCIHVVVCIILGIVAYVNTHPITHLYGFYFIVALTYIFFTVTTGIKIIHYLITWDSHLNRYTNQLIKKMNQVGTLDGIDVMPLDMINLKATPVELLGYSNLDFMHKMWLCQYEKLPTIVKRLEINVSTPYTPMGIISYYNIVFYYSSLGNDHQKATSYYSQIVNELRKDMDPNARRVLAYYHYYVLGNSERAVQYAKAGLANLDNFENSPAELKYEKKLLEALLSGIERNK